MTLMPYIESFAKWLGTTQLSAAVAGGVPWIWPLSETIHFIGLCLLFGVAGALDLRLLGVAKAIPVRRLTSLIPVAVIGMILNTITGALFFIGAPFQYVHNYPFWLKVLSIVLAGINVMIFEWSGTSREVNAIGPGGSAPVRAKATAAASLILWISVIWWGRMLPFLGNAF